ncbi:YutD family protein [Leuconostoc lactis]|uniref:YutD family protein n=1 Tax=Leuconostoc lactis TaxID=1246 RepID=UPI003B28B0F5
MDRDTLKERTLLQQAERKQAYAITRQGDEIEIDRLTLELVEDFKSAFDLDMLAVRYTPLLAQYDYIVGDISAEQLRLKGFYRNDKNVANDDKIEALQDYLYEYVNFGAPYFLLENVNPRPLEQEARPKNANRSRRNQRRKSNSEKEKRVIKPPIAHKTAKSNNKKPGKRAFVIKQK